MTILEQAIRQLDAAFRAFDLTLASHAVALVATAEQAVADMVSATAAIDELLS